MMAMQRTRTRPTDIRSCSCSRRRHRAQGAANRPERRSDGRPCCRKSFNRRLSECTPMAHRPWQIRAAAALIDLDQLVACPGGLDEQAQHEDADDMNPALALDLPAGDVTGTLLRSLSTAQEGITPFRHWRFADALPEDAAAAITDLPFLPPCLAAPGRREIINSTRVFFSAENRLRFPICREVAETLQ